MAKCRPPHRLYRILDFRPTQVARPAVAPGHHRRGLLRSTITSSGTQRYPSPNSLPLRLVARSVYTLLCRPTHEATQKEFETSVNALTCSWPNSRFAACTSPASCSVLRALAIGTLTVGCARNQAS